MKNPMYTVDLATNMSDLPIAMTTRAEGAQGTILTLSAPYTSVFGCGERFDKVQQKGMTRDLQVVEKFCNQGAFTYCPIPFFFTDTGFGLFINTEMPTCISFGDTIDITIRRETNGQLPTVHLFMGTPEQIMQSYYQLTGKPVLPPKWSFGLWMSANRWNHQRLVLEQLALATKHELPASVIVLEAWSDETTFYRWQDGAWENPAAMIQTLKEQGIHLLLWQIPVYKKLEAGQVSDLHDADCKTAVAQRLCVHDGDAPYYIPEGNWFGGSMIPDFTNPETCQSWFEKRQYLLDMGVDGFKTDGGEFIYNETASFHNGKTGAEMKNGYATSYVKAYTDFIGKDQILFSRAGYSGQQNYPMQWAGDQQSTWAEFRHAIVAGLSAGLSGIPYWGFDIAGFAGSMPSVSLYERAFQTAVFTPVMQWHSEPAGGQFAELMPAAGGINDRSPWHMATTYGDNTLVERLRFHQRMRYNLVPYLYHCALEAVAGKPVMKHLVWEYPNDPNVFGIEDCFMLGDIYIAPMLEPDAVTRDIYLPAGTWFDLWTNQVYEGDQTICVTVTGDRTPAFIREGGCLALNLGAEKKLGSDVGNQMTAYTNLCFYPVGNKGHFDFRDDLGNHIQLDWCDGKQTAVTLSGTQAFCIVSSIY